MAYHIMHHNTEGEKGGLLCFGGFTKCNARGVFTGPQIDPNAACILKAKSHSTAAA